MTKYKVLKPFVDTPGQLLAVGEMFDSLNAEYIEGLLKHDYIEPCQERWRAILEGKYYSANTKYNASTQTDFYTSYDNDLYQSGNYFKSKETAQLVADAQKLFFEWLHTPIEVTAAQKDTLYMRLNNAQNIARQAVLRDGEGVS